MRILTITAAALVALAAAACDNTDSNNQVSTDANLTEGDNAANAALGAGLDQPATAMPMAGADFAKAVAASDLYEIESAKLAAEKAQSAEIKSFAEHLRTDHEQSTKELSDAAKQANITVTPALDAEKQSMLDQLKAATGADFDRRFIDQQTTAHQKAMAMLQNYASAGDTESLKTFAGKASTVVKGHLDHLDSIRK